MTWTDPMELRKVTDIIYYSYKAELYELEPHWRPVWYNNGVRLGGREYKEAVIYIPWSYYVVIGMAERFFFAREQTHSTNDLLIFPLPNSIDGSMCHPGRMPPLEGFWSSGFNHDRTICGLDLTRFFRKQIGTTSDLFEHWATLTEDNIYNCAWNTLSKQQVLEKKEF